ncbi:chitinase [[Candida] zeylanoides]
MLSALIVFLCALRMSHAFDASSSSNVAVYWGQNSAGGANTQQSLEYYCQSDDVDIVLLSFLSAFPKMTLNFAGACSESFPDGLLRCDAIASGIKTCQAHGKIVLLSMGGASGNYGFSSDSDGVDFAEILWNTFGGGSSSERPFDDAVIDGFDLDLENNNQVGTVAFGNALRSWFAKDASKQYYLSAAPQCPYPDQSVGDFLAGVDVDFAFIQFYNNYCSLGANFNFDTWESYASGTSPNKSIKLYLGLAGSPTAAGSGYVDAGTVKQYLSKIQGGASFGGISIWDASQAFANVNSNGVNFAQEMKDFAHHIVNEFGDDILPEIANSGFGDGIFFDVVNDDVGDNFFLDIVNTNDVVESSSSTTSITPSVTIPGSRSTSSSLFETLPASLATTSVSQVKESTSSSSSTSSTSLEAATTEVKATIAPTTTSTEEINTTPTSKKPRVLLTVVTAPAVHETVTLYGHTTLITTVYGNPNQY